MRVDVDPVAVRKLDDRAILGPQMVSYARKARNQAARIAPKDSGAYAASLAARKSRGKFSTAVYGSDVYYARFIEFGSRTSPPKKDAARSRGRGAEWKITPHHTLYNAAIQVGMRVRKSR